jgi:hypothetical protein
MAAFQFQGKVFAHFHSVTTKHHCSMQNWLFRLPGWILREQSPRCQRKWWACFWLCSSPVLSFSVCPELSIHSNTCVRLMLCSSNACLIIARVSVSLLPRFAHDNAVPLSDPSQNRIRPDTRIQIKKLALPPSCVKFCTLTPKIC